MNVIQKSLLCVLIHSHQCDDAIVVAKGTHLVWMKGSRCHVSSRGRISMVAMATTDSHSKGTWFAYGEGGR